MKNDFLSKDIQKNNNEIHSCNNENAIVMYSGGLDSTVSLVWALNKYKNIKVLSIDYNQPHIIEIEVAKQIASLYDVNHTIIKVDFPKTFWGIKNYLTRGQACLMTSLAALDIGHEGADIVLGILSTDLYGDCNREFLDSLAEVLFHPNDWNPIGIATPLRAYSNKTDVIAEGYRMGAPICKTWTCRQPAEDTPCLKCMQCNERNSAKESIVSSYGISWEQICNWQDVLGTPYHPTFGDVDYKLKIFAESFKNIGGLKDCKVGWKYMSPDGRVRIASLIRNPNRDVIKNYHLGERCMHVSVHGFFENGQIWEVCICADGAIATTERLPDLQTIKNQFIRQMASG